MSIVDISCPLMSIDPPKSAPQQKWDIGDLSSIFGVTTFSMLPAEREKGNTKDISINRIKDLITSCFFIV
jgi:hypothetical protein